jgi:hypothetical protein
MPARMTVIITTTKPQILTSISSGVNLLFSIFNLWWFNLVCQDRGYKIFGTGLGEQASGLLALRKVKFIRILANIAVSVFTPTQQNNHRNGYNNQTP